jgi:hypothetical protein
MVMGELDGVDPIRRKENATPHYLSRSSSSANKIAFVACIRTPIASCRNVIPYSLAKRRRLLMAHKVSAIMRSDKGYSFDLTSADNVPLVHFLYLREGDAIAAAKQVRVAVANAKLVKPHMGGG